MVKLTYDGCNGSVEVLTVYETVDNSTPENENKLPALVDLEVRVGGLTTICTLPIEELDANGIRKQCPVFRCRKQKGMARFNDALMDKLMNGLADGSIQSGYYFTKSGLNILPDGQKCFVRGDKLIGSCNRPYKIAPEIKDIKLMGKGDSLPQLIPLLMASPFQVLLVLAYVILASIRSLLLDAKIDLQAVLYIVGGQGLGKTTLATRIAGIYQKNGNTAGIVQVGSTLAAVNSLMAVLRDQPMVVDDLCLSVSKDTARKRIELASKLIRQATGSIPIIKKAGKATVELPCEASIILTAEFHLENMSDLTRCVIVPIQESLDIPDELMPELIGDGVYHYSLWLTEHIQEELERFHESVNDAVSNWDVDARIATNYACLKAAFRSFARSLLDSGYSPKLVDFALDKMDKALKKAIKSHQAMIEQLKDSVPVGNLSYCILEGYRNDTFDLTTKIGKLHKHDGIIWKEDLCLRPEALIQFVRYQPGYRNWSSNRITRTLKDINALVLQEGAANTVHLSKGKDVPRVYRIRLKVLEETAQRC